MRILANRDYAVLRFVGAGMTAAIFAAHDTFLNRSVALKLALYSSEFFGDLLLRSAKKLGPVEHPGVVSPYAVVPFDDLLRPDSQHRGVVMRLVAGEPLSRADIEGMTDRERLVLFGRVCDALEACHAQGVFHGDLGNLDNVLLSDGRHPYLIDPGLSTRLDGTGGRLPGFRQHDLKALRSLAEFLFRTPIRLEMEESDTVRDAQAAIEKRLAFEFAEENVAYSRKKRVDLTGMGPGRGPLVVYERKEIRHSLLRASRRTRYRISLFPLESYEYHRTTIYADRYLNITDLEFNVTAATGSDLRACDVSIDTKIQTKASTLMVATIRFTTPLEAMRTHVLTIDYELESADDLRDGRCTEDFSILTRECVIELAFPESALPESWRAYRQRSPGEATIDELNLAELFELDRSENVGRLTISSVRPGESVHLDYGRGPTVYS